MADKTKLTRAELETAAKKADDAAAEIRKNGVTLVSSMQAQAQGFTGLAGTAFRNALGGLMDDLNVILAKLEEMSNNARTSANRLGAQDEQSAGSLTKVGSGTVTTGLT